MRETVEFPELVAAIDECLATSPLARVRNVHAGGAITYHRVR